jgi:uncharacterized membrane protein YecN with MAPEG domain
MHAIPITALYAGMLGIIAVALGANVGRKRVSTEVSILHGDDMDLALAIRKHGNFAEWVPLHVMGVSLVVFRISHPLGLQAETPQPAGRAIARAIGFLGTTLLVSVASIWAILTFF